YSQFYTSPLNLNPALTGAFEGVFRFGVNQKTQWLSVTKPYLTFTGSFDAPVIKSNSKRQLLGVGLTINSDRAGDSKYSSFQAIFSLSYIKSIGRKNRHKFGIGAYGGIIQRKIDYSTLTFDEQFLGGVFDPGFPITETFDKNNFVFFDCGAGFFWSYTPNKTNTFSMGASARHLNRPNQAVNDIATRLAIHYSAYFTSRFEIHHNLSLEPMLYTAFQRQAYEILFGSNIEYFIKKNNHMELFSFGGGMFYRWNDALILMGFFDWQNLRIGLSYDINLSPFLTATKGRGGVEVSVIYMYKKKRISQLGKEPCPFDVM
ncbi:MAG: PorP/SprF family type IX secretion system membrane protein, partial [Bacteroidales bacterium]